jgi:anti-sigma regulatory factor (Ser/Thr protein kinase)
MRDISLHILDIAENSVRAGASLIRIVVAIDQAQDTLTVVIEDNGCGMSREMMDRVKSPFTTSRTTRKVGLGIPLFAAGCENTGGSLDIESAPGEGTKLTAVYRNSHIDRPPLGDIAQTVCALVLMNPEIDFDFTARRDEAFAFDTREIKKTLDGLPITQPEVVTFLREFLSEGTEIVFGGEAQ